MNEESHDNSGEPPGQGRPPHPWEEVSFQKWNDWRWQLSNRLTTLDALARVLRLTQEETTALSAPGYFRVAVTPYFASLMDPGDHHCPIRRQVVPTSFEMVPFEAEMADSLSEDEHSPVPGLVHRYPDRALMLITGECASYCRFCTRNRTVGSSCMQFGTAVYERQLDYIRSTPQVRDVLLSGGDPLTMSPRVLEGLLSRLRAIPHVEVIRIGTRAPVFVPQRITDELVGMLRQYHPLWINIHFNHPKEITPEVETALSRLADAGIPLGSQTVLLAGINDCPSVMKDLVRRLVKNRVRPYYLYQCDLVHGAGHFRTPVSKGVEIMESLRGHTSGFAVPTYVIDAPYGGGKVPVLPNYLLSLSDSRVVVRNYEGLISTYTQPAEYHAHDASTCAYCQSQSDREGAQGGVAGLLAGHAATIEPEGWHATHSRDGQEGEPLPMTLWTGARADVLPVSPAAVPQKQAVSCSPRRTSRVV